MTLISIVIPSFNKAAYIARTLDSILDQHYPALEVIIEDGGSTDGTLDIIKRYARKYPKIIKWVSHPDGGQLNAINSGLNKAAGQIITFINADDEYTPRCFSLVNTAYINHPNLLWIAGQGSIIDQNNLPGFSFVTLYKNILLRLNKYFLLLIVNYISQPSVFITKKAYQQYGPFTGTSKFVMEYDLWLKLGKVRLPYIINYPLSRFRLALGNISSSQSSALLAADMEIARKYTSRPLYLFLHQLNNSFRLLLVKLV